MQMRMLIFLIISSAVGQDFDPFLDDENQDTQDSISGDLIGENLIDDGLIVPDGEISEAEIGNIDYEVESVEEYFNE